VATIPQLIEQATGGSNSDSPDVSAPSDHQNDYGEKNRDLPDQLKTILKAVISECQKRDLYDRRIEVLKDRLHRFYSDGIQHVYPNYGTGVYQIGTAGGYVDVGNKHVQCPNYMDDYNIFFPYQRSLEAVLTQSPPAIEADPDDPSQAEDIEAAQVGEGYRKKFDQANDIKDLQKKIARMFCLSGRTVAWTFTMADEQKWGTNEQGEPRQMETARVFGILESKVPIFAKCLEDCPFVFLFDDPDVWNAKKEYEHIKDKIEGGQGSPGESDWERWARLGVRQARKSYFLSGTSLQFVTTRLNAFLRPSSFECDDCDAVYEGDDATENEDGEAQTVRDKFKELFPTGAHVVFVGDNYAESWEESVDDAIDIAFPRQGDGMTGRAMMENMVVIQDSYNDKKNAEREAYEKGWPCTWVSGKAVDYDAILNQRSEPYAYHEIKELRAGEKVQDVVYREPEMVLSATFIQSMAEDRGPLPQFIVGALPALTGEVAPGDHTASKTAMDRSQAMGMLGMAASAMGGMFAGIYYHAALLATKNPDHAKGIVVTGQGGTAKYQIEKLTKGNFHFHLTDSNFPDSVAARRANLQNIVATAAASPLGATIFESPDNWEKYLELNGHGDLTLVPAMAYEKQTAEIEILLRESPVMPAPEEIQQAQIAHAAQAVQGAAQGLPAPPFMPPQPTSSVSIGKFDYDKWEFAKCQEFLSSDDCRREKAQGNDAGVANVELHAAAHQQKMMMEMMQQAAMAPPPGGPAKPPAPTHAPEAATSVQKKSTPPGAATV
jgi:hypothetical protein